jgi:large subunit ribosomal protein L19
MIVKIVVKRSGETRRAKLLYLRQRVGKSTRLQDKKVKKTEETREPALAGA